MSTPYVSVYNVKDYGAVGDGVTDDTAAIKNAIAAAAATGGTVYAPPASYAISDTLVFGDGSATAQSTVYGIGMLGNGSGGAVTLAPSTGITRFKWIGSSDRPMLKVLGPISSVNMKGFLLDGNGSAQDGIWEIYMHGSQWEDVFTISMLRAHWFRTRWLTNPSGSNPFVEGSSSNVFINCGCSGGSVSPSSGTLWGLIMGGNPTDPTDRTSTNVSDPYNSIFIKCRFRFDGANNSIAGEFRFTDSNIFIQPDFVGQYGIAVAQNPNYTNFPSAFMYTAFISGNAYTPSGAMYMATIGTYVSNGACIQFHPLGDFGNNPGIPDGTFLPWALGEDAFGAQLWFGGFRPQGYTLQAIDTSVHTISPGDTSFHAFSFISTFEVKQGDPGLAGVNLKGANFKIEAAGTTSTGTSPGSIRLQALIGSVVIADTQNVALSASQSTAVWEIQIDAVVAALASTTYSLTQLKAKMAFAGASSNAGVIQLMPLTSGGSSSSIPFTSNQPITIQAAFTSASGNSINCQIAKYELQNAQYKFIG